MEAPRHTLSTLHDACEERDKKLEAGGEEAYFIELQETLTGQVDQYFQLVLRFDNLRRTKEFVDDHKYRDYIEATDHSRRIVHTALIDNMRIITRQLGGNYATWFNQFRNNRDSIKLWSLHQAFHRWKQAEEELHAKTK